MSIKTIPFLFFIFLIHISCNKEEETPQLPEEEISEMTPSYILTGKIFGCGTYETIDTDHEDALWSMFEFNDHFFFEFSDHLVIKDAFDGNVLLEQEMNINAFKELGSKLLICAEEGIFEVDENLNIEQKMHYRCRDLQTTSEDRVLILTSYTVDSSGAYHSDHIYEADLTTNTLSSHVSLHSDDSPRISNFLVDADDNIWAMMRQDSCLKIQDGVIVESFNSSNSNFGDGYDIFMALYNSNDLIVVDGGPAFDHYKVMKYSSSGWINLLSFDAPETDKEKELSLPSLTNINIINNKLYVSTTIAGCRGIHVFNLNKNEPLNEEEYFIYQDENLPGQCIENIYIGKDGTIYILNQKRITAIRC